MRRQLCWPRVEIDYIANAVNMNLPAGATLDTMFPVHTVDSEVKALIIKSNAVDFELYATANATLWFVQKLATTDGKRAAYF
eukprot:m.211880 g.211880  ORF g.211880 m.211880 type:complete len:82 (+) comp16942_c9_seq10:127-372(+)